MNNKKFNILGVSIDNIKENSIFSIINKKIKNKEKFQIITINPEMIINAQKNLKFLKIINKADLVIPDGYGVVWAIKKMTGYKIKKIPGIDLMDKLLFLSEKNNYSVYLYGAKKNIISKAFYNIKEKFPKIKIVGFNNGYLSKKEFNNVLIKIEKLKPNIIFIGLGSPKQEFLGFNILKIIKRGIVIGIGGSLDIYSGKIKRAPIFIRKINLEWLYRNIFDIKRIKRLGKIFIYIKEIYKKIYYK